MMDSGKRPPLDEQKSLWEASLAAEGVTTGAGAATGDSFIDAGLIGAGANSFISMLAVIYPGQPANVDSMDITAFNNVTGEVTLAKAYKGVAAAIPAGVPYKIVTFRFVPAEVAAIAAAVAIIDGFHDIPGVDAVANAQMRDVIGGKADTPIFSGAFDVSSIIRYLKGLMGASIPAWGTADAGSDADTLVDAARAEANDYWNGMTLLMISGANAGLARRIYDYAVGSIEVRDAFPNAIVATDTYVILSDYEALLAAVDSAENLLVRDVIGGKADTAVTVPDNVSSIIRYLKGILNVSTAVQHETEWATVAVVEQIANAAAVALTAGQIIPTFPAGSTRVRAILIASIHAANQAANTHHIDLKVQGQIDAGGYGDLLDLTAAQSLGLVNLDGAADGLAVAVDVTALVTTSGSTYDFRFQVDSDNAGAVNYTTSFVLVLVYTM